MPKFFNHEVGDLAQQLTRSPRRLRVDQVHGIEHLLEIIDPDRAYPYEFVCFHITKYHKRGPTTGHSVPGQALMSDLVTMAELLTRQAGVTVAELGEPYLTHQGVAEALEVSTKTIRRWRNRGLMGIRVVFEDGVNRLAFLKRTVDRFTKQNHELVARGASFKQLSEAERRTIVDRAGELAANGTVKLHAAARVIAEETGRAVETIRYTLRRHDSANPDGALFGQKARSAQCERDLAILHCREAGETIRSIAKAFGCKADDIRLALRRVEARRWVEQRWDFVHHELFDAPNADALILDVPEPVCTDAKKSPAPRKDAPAYVQSLYRTPLLSREQEHDLFRRYNYLKFKVSKAIAAMDLDEIGQALFDRVTDLVQRVETMRQRIIQANLRLVVSIAKKHVGWSPEFFQVISDGNMSLMRAVEKFDFGRGTRFSTYATWAIVKNYARSIPEERYRNPRHVTGQDELLDATADHRDAPASDSDRQRVRELISTGLKVLDSREQEVVKSHFGLGGSGETLTLEQLGQRFGVTKERVRQIEQRALSRLREVLSPSLIDALPD